MSPFLDKIVDFEVIAKHRLSVRLLSNEVLSAELEVRDVDLDGDVDVKAFVKLSGKTVFEGSVDLSEIEVPFLISNSVIDALVSIAESATGVDVPGVGKGK